LKNRKKGAETMFKEIEANLSFRKCWMDGSRVKSAPCQFSEAKGLIASINFTFSVAVITPYHYLGFIKEINDNELILNDNTKLIIL